MPPDCTEDAVDAYAYDLSNDPGMFLADGTYQVIKWSQFQSSKWLSLHDDQGKEL